LTHLITIWNCEKIRNHILIGSCSKDKEMDNVSFKELQSIFVYLVVTIDVLMLLYIACLDKGLHSVGFLCMLLVSFVKHVLM
jgi:hypothetical protein